MTTNNRVKFVVFTKPWKLPIDRLGELVRKLGFDGLELPVRPGYAVDPENVTRTLPEATRQLQRCGLKIHSVAGGTDEATIAACGAAGIPLLRICLPLASTDYLAEEAAWRRQFDALVPQLDRHGVTLGIQNHCGQFVCHALGLRRLFEPYSPKHIAAVWDAAHNALNGEDPELALHIVWSHLCMVNLKNAFWRRTTGPEAESMAYEPYWTSGRQGLASWPRVAGELQRRRWKGTICLPAEYTIEAEVDRLIAEDLAFARRLFGEGPKG